MIISFNCEKTKRSIENKNDVTFQSDAPGPMSVLGNVFDEIIIFIVLSPYPKKIAFSTPEWIHRAEYNCVLLKKN